MKKKLLVLLGASALVLTACGGSTDGTATTNGDNQDLVTNTTDASGAVGSDIDQRLLIGPLFHLFQPLQMLVHVLKF